MTELDYLRHIVAELDRQGWLMVIQTIQLGLIALLIAWNTK